MKRLGKMSNGRSSSRTKSRAAAAHVSEQAEAEEIIIKTSQKPKFASLYEEEEEDDDDEGEGNYGLRQNPRKTCTIPSSTNGVNHQKKFICEKCGKGFQSSKARCGHMACHSRVSAKQEKVVEVDSESDTESSGVKKQRMRLRLRRHKSGGDSKAKVDVFNNCSSGVSGIEQEEEEVAISLMMLSRDSANSGGFNSVDSSDNNSVILEDRSILGIRKSGLISGCDVNVRSKKIKTLGNFESGYVGNGAKYVGSDLKIRNARKNGLAEGAAVEPHLNPRKLKNALDSEGYREIQSPEIDPSPTKCGSYESHSSEIRIRFEDKALINSHQSSDANAARHKSPVAASPCDIDAYHSRPNGKGKKHECLVCYKTFRSGQALGSRMRVHSADGSEEVKCDEDPAHFNGTQLLDSFDLNLPAPMDDEEASESMSMSMSMSHY